VYVHVDGWIYVCIWMRNLSVLVCAHRCACFCVYADKICLCGCILGYANLFVHAAEVEDIWSPSPCVNGNTLYVCICVVMEN
jgi:hypothetical protein